MGSTQMGPLALWYEKLAEPDLSIDRNIFDFKTVPVSLKYYTGRIAESWEIAPDFNSYIFHIRKGVYWQDIPPMNGRELTASDIEWNWNRNLGLGGFPKSPYFPVGNYEDIASITATDKYTVVFKTSKPSVDMIRMLLDTISSGNIMPREAVEK